MELKKQLSNTLGTWQTAEKKTSPERWLFRCVPNPYWLQTDDKQVMSCCAVPISQKCKWAVCQESVFYNNVLLIACCCCNSYDDHPRSNDAARWWLQRDYKPHSSVWCCGRHVSIACHMCGLVPVLQCVRYDVCLYSICLVFAVTWCPHRDQ